MKASELRHKLIEYTVSNSGHQQERDYLGMSQISKPEYELIEGLRTGRATWQPNDMDHCRLALGYVFEDYVKWVLDGILREMPAVSYYDLETRDIAADFDGRFRGHVDGEFGMEGKRYLLEIKSTFDEKLARIIRDRELPVEIWEQVQMYLHHGKFDAAMVVFVARDTGRYWVYAAYPNRKLMAHLNAKARRILDAVPATAAA